jgi:hypothetical protein
MSYYILQNDETKGPYTVGQLRSMWSSGQITGDTLYCEEGYDNWLHLRGLADELERPTQPPIIPGPTMPTPSVPPRRTRVAPTVFWVIGVVVALGVVWLVWDSTKPKVLARINIKREAVVIINGNDVPWKNPTITLNDAFDGPTMQINGTWDPGERRELILSEFTGRINNQRFNPEFERVKEVIIDVQGFQLGTYR